MGVGEFPPHMEYHRQKSLKLRKGISVAGFWNLSFCFGSKDETVRLRTEPAIA